MHVQGFLACPFPISVMLVFRAVLYIFMPLHWVFAHWFLHTGVLVLLISQLLLLFLEQG